MTRIKKLFEKKNKRILNVYCTAGYPTIKDTLEIMSALQNNGADMIELGMPYSDPLADGPVIQASSLRAIENGMTLTRLFDQLENFRNQVEIPVILMGYMNTVLQYGFEKFCRRAAEVGIDGLILPDLPIYEFNREYREIVSKFGLDFIFLVTPETSDERIKQLDSLSSGFLYAVSSSSTTGTNKDLDLQHSYLKRLQDLGLINPVLVGFGIRDKQTFDEACQYANGAIIGSAYIKALENSVNIDQSTKQFLEKIIQKS